jgi:hypothetical protein
MSLLPLGLLSQGGGAPSTFELISTTVASGSSSSVTFSSIPATYKHLQVRMTMRGGAAVLTNIFNLLSFNGDTAANYAWHSLEGTGSVIQSIAGSDVTSIRAGVFPGDSSTASSFSGTILDIMDYADVNKFKTSRLLAGSNTATARTIRLSSGLWRSTSAITSLSFTSDNGNYASGSRFTLYGIRG